MSHKNYYMNYFYHHKQNDLGSWGANTRSVIKSLQMQTKLQIVGHYQSIGHKFTNPFKPFVLVLNVRKTVTSTKAPFFLVAKSTTGQFDNGKKDQYISSVYPIAGKPFSKIEYQGVNYEFEYTTEGAEIRPCGQMAMYINSHL